MAAQMALSYVPGKRFAGEVLYIYPFLTAKTRTARLRLSFPNNDYLLKPAMYANVYLESASPADSLVIPQEAVIDSGVRKVVFVALGKGRFQPRDIVTGLVGNNEIQVLEGLNENETIVLSGQFLLDSESRLQEAVQKMLAAQEKHAAADDDTKAIATPDQTAMDMAELDMAGLSMD
jgi:Cu(I)/Ag(I) efflux system membrane fusion protein/cobalt-zinc-cadmium efflux system membrane fusion protein